MATFRKRGARWQAQVRRIGYPPLSKSFLKKSAAELWAKQKEVELDRGDAVTPVPRLDGRSVADLLGRYLEQVTPRKRGAGPEAARVRAMLRAPLARLLLRDLEPRAIATYRDERLKRVSGSTVSRELAILQHCFELARREWGVGLPSNPVASVLKPPSARPRARRVENDEFAALDAALQACRNPLMVEIFRFALETGARRGEALSLRWDHVDLQRRTAYLPLTKNGEARLLPLSPGALAILARVKDINARSAEAPLQRRVFSVSANALRLAWERAKRRAAVRDLRFHDLRHEAISRFFEVGLTVPEVALISGHKDPRMLFRYAHMRAETIARKLGGAVSPK